MDRSVITELIGKNVKITIFINDNNLFYSGQFLQVFETSTKFIDKYNTIFFFDLDKIERVEVQNDE